LREVTLNNGLTDIGANAFYGCRNLREVELNGVPQYLKSTFYNCNALERFLFPKPYHVVLRILFRLAIGKDWRIS